MIEKSTCYLMVFFCLFACKPNDSRSQDNSLIGTWQVSSIQLDGIMIVKAAGDQDITLIFDENLKLSGRAFNVLDGYYKQTKKNQIHMALQPITEAGESEWGESFFTFFSPFGENYQFNLKSTELTINDANNQNIIILKKIK